MTFEDSYSRDEADILWKKMSEPGENIALVVAEFAQERLEIGILKEEFKISELNDNEEVIEALMVKLNNKIAEFNKKLDEKLIPAKSKDYEIASKNFADFMDRELLEEGEVL